MSLPLAVDLASATPPYEQLRAQLVARIENGVLAPGDRLPTVRALATELALAPNTVAKTYRELEAAGYVRTDRRRGTTVAASDQSPDGEARRLALEFLARTSALGLSAPDTLRLLRSVIDD